MSPPARPTPRRRWIEAVLSLLVLAGVLWIAWTAYWAVRVQTEHMDDPDGLYEFRGEIMLQRTIVLDKIFTREVVGPWRHAFLAQDRLLLWSCLYVTFAVVGWCGSVWLRDIVPRSLSVPILPSLLLAALSGVISLLLVRLLALLPHWPGSAWSYGLALPVLAGLFLTRFYEKAEGLLVAMMDAVQQGLKKLVGTLAFLTLSGSALAAAPAENPPDSSSLSVTYYRCLQPEDAKCIALTPKDKELCPKCAKWETKVASLDVANLLPTQTSSSPLSQANYFLAVAAEEFCGHNWPTTRYGYPVPVQDVYRNPERWGWREAKESGPGEGCLAVYPKMGGLVVGTAGQPGLSDVSVLYPSYSRGALAITNAGALGEVKLIEPQSKPQD
jgi:hypothetical protein